MSSQIRRPPRLSGPARQRVEFGRPTSACDPQSDQAARQAYEAVERRHEGSQMAHLNGCSTGGSCGTAWLAGGSRDHTTLGAPLQAPLQDGSALDE